MRDGPRPAAYLHAWWRRAREVSPKLRAAAPILAAFERPCGPGCARLRRRPQRRSERRAFARHSQAGCVLRLVLAQVPALVGLALAAGAGLPSPAGPVAAAQWGSAAPVTYQPPVPLPLRVVRSFDPPATPYGPGHLGVDLAVPAGQPILAAGPGVVGFAGPVAGRGVVVVDHPDGIRTEYEPVTVLVRRGAAVVAGTPVGTLAGHHAGCAVRRCLHWGARRGEQYLDPLGLLAPLGPVRLLPWVARPMSGARVRAAVGAAQPLDRDMGVDLRRRKIRVPEQFLHRAQVGAPLEQVRGRRVPQPVRSDVGSPGHLRDPPVDDPPNRPRVDAPAARAEQ